MPTSPLSGAGCGKRPGLSTLRPVVHRLGRGAGDRLSLLAGGGGKGGQAACCFPHQPEDGFVSSTLDLCVPPAGFRKSKCVLPSVRCVPVLHRQHSPQPFSYDRYAVAATIGQSPAGQTRPVCGRRHHGPVVKTSAWH